MFEGFELRDIDIGEISICARIGGQGPPLLLLHGNPQTHVMWHAVAPALSEHFTVIATDLTGYGRSGKPASDAGHERYSKRAMARDQIAVMKYLGFERFHVAGHDRGARVGYRMALDFPHVVRKLAVLDIVPTSEAFARGGRDFGLGYYHWFFLAQPYPLPERLIGADPDWFWRWHTTRGPRDIFAPEAVEDYLTCFRNPKTIHAICEDYRAAATIDCVHDDQDRRAGHQIACPVLALWGEHGKLEAWYDTLSLWRAWGRDVGGRSLPCGHYLAEELPKQTARELLDFFA